MIGANITKIIENEWFETEEDFVNHINGLKNIGKARKKELIDHERAHYNKAIELGYSPKYSYRQERTNKGGYFPVTTINPRVIVEDCLFTHCNEIALAPKKPSKGDLRVAKQE